MARPVLLLDDGGVMNDSLVRGPQWQRLVGEFFVPILGGEQLAWQEANRFVMDNIMIADGAWMAHLAAAQSYEDFERKYFVEWLGAMCAHVGVARPEEDTCVELGRRANEWIPQHVRSAFPGSIDAIRALYEQGYELHTASGESSRELASYLQGMGVHECFGKLYGPDLINTFKNGPRYYERLFADLGIDPAHALVVDDRPAAIAWASSVGARTVLVGAEESKTSFCISSLAALPDMLHMLD